MQWGHALKLIILLTVFFLCDIRCSLSLAVSQINSVHSRQYYDFFLGGGKICAGWHNVFCSECWRKLLSSGQAHPAPPTVVTTLHITVLFIMVGLCVKRLLSPRFDTQPGPCELSCASVLCCATRVFQTIRFFSLVKNQTLSISG